MKLKAIVLAAGESSRFWPLASRHHKSLYPIMGKPVIQYTIEGLAESGIDEIAVIVSPSDDTIQTRFNNGSELNVKIAYFVQARPEGMGDAVLQAKNWVGDAPFVIVNADQVNAADLLKPKLEMLSEHNDSMILSAQKTDTPWNYGVLKIENHQVKQIVEKPAKGTEPGNLMVIGIYLMPSAFLSILAQEPPSHYNFETAIQKYIDQHDRVYAVTHPDDLPEITLKFPWHLFTVNRYLMKKYLRETFIHHTAQISPLSLITGTVHIGANVRVFENGVIKGPAYISDGVIIGNNSLVRDHSAIGQNSMVGFGTEVKNSIIFDNVETHANYIGDSIVDTGCGFGAGTITANRRLDRGEIYTNVKDNKVNTNLTFFGMVTGRNVKTGIQAGIMPGIKIGSNCQIGANTMVMKDLPDNHVCYNKPDQIIKLIE